MSVSVVCIDGVEDTDVLPKHDSTPPRPHKDSMGAADPPAAIEAKPHIKEGFSTGSDVMDDILQHSQQRMLEAIEHLSRRVDVLAVSARDSVPLQRSIGSSTLSPNIA